MFPYNTDQTQGKQKNGLFTRWVLNDDRHPGESERIKKSRGKGNAWGDHQENDEGCSFAVKKKKRNSRPTCSP